MADELATFPASNPVLPVGRGIMKSMVPAEDSIDAAIAGTSKLLATVAAGRVQSGVGVDVGGNAMQSIWNGIGALLTAREHISKGHGQLATIRDALGMSAEEFGCSGTKGGGQQNAVRPA